MRHNQITSRFDGIIKKLHYDADDMALVGKPLVDIDIQSELSPEDEALTTPPAEQAGGLTSAQQPQKAIQDASPEPTRATDDGVPQESNDRNNKLKRGEKGKSAGLATPAVRHLVKEHNVDIADIDGTGRDGRVMKEDVHKHIAARQSASAPKTMASPTGLAKTVPDRTITLSPVQSAMFKTMIRSLSIPHFLYTDTIDIGPISLLRRTLNKSALSLSADLSNQGLKLTLLPFLVKALSIAMSEYPILNARIDNATSTSSPNDKPTLTLRGSHNIGIACDTPQGLVVPVIKSVQSHSIISIAQEAIRLSILARDGKLKADDMTGGTFTVSNVGSIGGGVVAPVIVENQMGIVGLGRAKIVPAFGINGELVRREEVTLSWSADHRIIDGATVARAADYARQLMEEPARMLVVLR